jgi:6-pyruvoyl tetrahydropterin synthase/QueD family protein
MADKNEAPPARPATVTKTFRWAASHWLDGVPPDHKCARLHGHNYQATVAVVGQVDQDTGMVVDYAVLTATIGQWIKDNWDHRHLGPRDLFTIVDMDEFAHGGNPDPFAVAVFPGQSPTHANPTAENLAAYLLAIARTLLPLETVVSVTIRETPDTSAVAS